MLSSMKKMGFGLLAAVICYLSWAAVPIAAVQPALEGVVISGPQNIPSGECIAFKVTAVDQNGHPFKVFQKKRVVLELQQPASAVFSASSTCAIPQSEFFIKAGHASKTFYVFDRFVESVGVQPFLRRRSSIWIEGAPFAINFEADSPTPTPAPKPTASPTPTPAPSPTPSLNVTYDACWYENGGNQYQALEFQLANPATLILQGELYTGSGCVPANWDDQLNDSGEALSFGTAEYVFWFTHRPNLTDVSVIWSFSDTSGNPLWTSECIDYSDAPPC